MIFTINKYTLEYGIRDIINVIEQINNIDELKCIKITAKDSGITLTSTDLDITSCVNLEAQISTHGEVLVGGKILFDIIKKLNSDSIHFIKSDNDLLEIRSNKSRYKIKCLDSAGSEYFEIEDVDFDKTIQLQGCELATLLNNAKISIGNQGASYATGGVFLQLITNGEAKEVRVVSTNVPVAE